jgi:hypothetical protein
VPDSQIHRELRHVGLWFGLLNELSREGVVAAWGALVLAMLLARASARAATRRWLEPERCLAIGDPAIADHLRRKVADSRANATLALTPHRG